MATKELALKTGMLKRLRRGAAAGNNGDANTLRAVGWYVRDVKAARAIENTTSYKQPVRDIAKRSRKSSMSNIKSELTNALIRHTKEDTRPANSGPVKARIASAEHAQPPSRSKVKKKKTTKMPVAAGEENLVAVVIKTKSGERTYWMTPEHAKKHPKKTTKTPKGKKTKPSKAKEKTAKKKSTKKVASRKKAKKA